MLRSQSSIRLLVLRRRPLDGLVRGEQLLADSVDADEPVVDDAEEERRPAAPADRVAVGDPAGVDEQALVAQRGDDRLLGLGRRHALVAGRSPGRSGRPRRSATITGRPWTRRELEVLGAARRARCGRCPCPRRARPRPTGSRGASTPILRRQLVERAVVLEPDELLAVHHAVVVAAPPSARRPLAVLPSPYSASGLTAAATFAGSVHGVVVQTTSDSVALASGKRT